MNAVARILARLAVPIGNALKSPQARAWLSRALGVSVTTAKEGLSALQKAGAKMSVAGWCKIVFDLILMGVGTMQFMELLSDDEELSTLSSTWASAKGSLPALPSGTIDVVAKPESGGSFLGSVFGSDTPADPQAEAHALRERMDAVQLLVGQFGSPERVRRLMSAMSVVQPNDVDTYETLYSRR